MSQKFNEKPEKVNKTGRPIDDFSQVEGMALFATKTGFTLKEIKDAKATPEGAKAFKNRTRIDPAILIPVLVSALRNRGGKKSEVLDGQQEKAKLDAARRRKIEREEAIEDKLLHTRDGVEERVWGGGLLPLRAELSTLAKTLKAEAGLTDDQFAQVQKRVQIVIGKINAMEPKK